MKLISETGHASAPGRSQTYKAVIFATLSMQIVPMINAWLASGNHVCAVVTYGIRRPRPLTSPLQWYALNRFILPVLRRNSISLIELGPPLDWAKLRERLAADVPDVCITSGFMRLLPRELLCLFPLGALNFHPALLPHYRGPKPYHWLAIDDAFDRYGGVTLHEMSDSFDTGPIVAQAAMSDVGTRRDPTGFTTDAVACMTRDVIPRYCAGELKAWPQQPGKYPYAHHELPPQVVQPHWTRARLQVLCSLFVKRPGVTIETPSGRLRLLSEVLALGPPTGEPVRVRWRSVEFDLADQRVRYSRHGPLSKLVWSIVRFRRHLMRGRTEVPIRLGPPVSLG